MSDVEEKKSGYRLEYAKNNRAKCKGPKPCNGTVLEKGTLKIGSVVDFRGHPSFSWRHWGCTTTTIINNMKNSFSKADELDGFDDLQPEDQEKIRKAWDDGHVADEDVPETARKPDAVDDANEEAKPKKKRAPAKKDGEGDVPKAKKARPSKKKSDEEGDVPVDDDGEKEEPKKAPASKPRSKKAKDEDKQLNGKEGGEEKTEKKAGPPKKAPAPKKVTEKKAPAKKRASKRVLFFPLRVYPRYFTFFTGCRGVWRGLCR
ncbi:hypothetical protein BC827DRAFT_1171214 [Russula dissimulans]|nr:hypothetical protein BC827DRAFT_1171214 [Russula dissimulans]